MSHTATDTETKVKLKIPKLYKVVLFNDDYTPMDFVMQVLVEIFGKNVAEAHDITMAVHDQGRGVIDIYTREVADQLLMETHTAAERYGHPLKGEVEEA